MKKQIFIVNGRARAGKDTFADFLNCFIPTFKYSSVDKVKRIARLCGWEGGKDEKDRKFLSDLKVLTTEYCDMAFADISHAVKRFHETNVAAVMLIDIREPAEIERACREFGAKSVLIVNDRVPVIESNMADAGVMDYEEYDYVLYNNGSLEEFKDTVKEFARDIVLRYEEKPNGQSRETKDGTSGSN